MNINEIARQLRPQLDVLMANFFANSVVDVVSLTKEQIKAIFDNALYVELKLEELPPNPTREQIAWNQAIVAQNSRDLLLCTAAERADAASYAAVRDRAVTLAKTVGATLISAGVIALKQSFARTADLAASQ